MLLGKIIADFETQLATQLDPAGTTATLQTATDDDGVALPTGRYFLTIDNSNSSKEYFSCTLTGTSLTALKSVSRQGVETSGAIRKHRVGASVSLTDFANLKVLTDLLSGGAQLDSTNPLTYDGTATINSANQLATVAYVLSVVNGGTLSLNQVNVAGIAGETFSAGQVVYLKAADSYWYKVLANDATLAATQGVQMGVALGAGSAGVSISGGVAIQGVVVGLSGLTANNLYYVSDTGTLSTSAGTYSIPVGVSLSTTSLLFLNGRSPSTYEKAAMGTVNVAPSGANKFITQHELVNVQTFKGIGGGQTFTVTIATPGLFTLNNHGFVAGDTVVFTTSGALPTGLTAGTTYYVIAGGLTANTFEVSATSGGSAINTTGSQSGTHTVNNTWVKPTGASLIRIIAIGAGGGGQGGSGLGGGTAGTGAGGGGYSEMMIPASLITSPVTVTIGTGGAGGAGTAGGGGAGASGSNGGNTTFGAYLKAGGGVGGVAGTPGAGGTGTIAGGAGSTIGGTNGNSSPLAGGGGAGGSTSAGGVGGVVTAIPRAGGTAGSAGVGGAGVSAQVGEATGGSGGGGGSGSSSTGSANGGAGGNYGGGGGGGGTPSSSNAQGGNGGTGGNGIVQVITYF